MSQLENILEKLRRVSQDPDVDDKKGTQPKKYYSGVKKDKKDARDAHFKKGASMSDDNPDAYKPAPGDKDEDGKMKKTKPSKHTDKFKQMYGEACWDGYKKVGMKKKGDKMVPNCVPEMNEKNKDMTAISTWKKNLKKVKGLSKDTMQQLSTLPTPVITSLINQIGMIVAQYNEELEESYDVRKYMNLKKQLANLRTQADKAESGGRKDSLMGIHKRMDQIKDKMHKVKYEELGPNADAGDYIDDFRKSDAPQFKGKSDKKIRKMAIAAYLDKKEK